MTAKVAIESVAFTCPKCSEGVPEPNSGSLFWAVNEITVTHATCLNGHLVNLPKRVGGIKWAE